MLGNLAELEFLITLLNRLSRLDIVMLDKLAKEARGLEVFHRLALLGTLIVILYVTNHGLSAIGIECLFRTG